MKDEVKIPPYKVYVNVTSFNKAVPQLGRHISTRDMHVFDHACVKK